MKQAFKDLLPYMGSYNAENSMTPQVGGGNFMWHGMMAFQWHHQSSHDIENTIRDLGDILKKKEAMKEAIVEMIKDFDWSHQYSDDIRPSKVQKERDTHFNECIAMCPMDIKEFAYKQFITSYLLYSPNGKSPISFEVFLKGVRV